MKYFLFFLIVCVVGAGWYLWPSKTTYIQLDMGNAKETNALPTLPDDYPDGGVVMIGHWAETPVASTTARIEEYGVGGVIIMSAPSDPTEILSWTKEWQAASTYPLLIAIDQEGGPVSRLRGEGFTQTAQREITTEAEAYEVGRERGLELSALGINMNFAPVLDTATSSEAFMYSRVFPADTDEARLAAAMARGMADSGVIAAAKHFPGHPNAPADSHFELPIVDISRDQLDTFTTPFREYITLAAPQALMTAHVSFPQIDALPATLSHLFLTDYLRGELGFQGLIITDDMSMDAIDATMSVPEASILSLEAGADMILLAAIPEEVSTVLPALESHLRRNAHFSTQLYDAKLQTHLLRASLAKPVSQDIAPQQ